MNFIPLGEMQLTYVGPAITLVDFGTGGRYYAHMEGRWESDRIRGDLRLTNTAAKRADNINTPELDGVLETDDGASLFVEMRGLAQIQAGGRVFITSLTLRSAHPDYQWANTLFAVVEGELHGQPKPGEARANCRVYACEATIEPVSSAARPRIPDVAYLIPAASTSPEAHDLVRNLEPLPSGDEGIRREALFWQPPGLRPGLVVYQEFGAEGGIAIGSARLREATAELGWPPSSEPKVELLVRLRVGAPGDIYAVALPLRGGKVARLHDWALDLNSVHATELEESLRRVAASLTLFVQHLDGDEVVLLVVEGRSPDGALGQIATSPHPFDRWFIRGLEEVTGVDFAVSPLHGPERLW